MNRRPSKPLLTVLPIVVLLLSPIRSTATSVVMLSDTDLIVSSRFIVTGKVRSVTSAWDDTRSEAWTYVKVRVARVLKGEFEARTLVLKQPGGGDGLSGMRVFGQPQFSPGQRVLLYLNTGPDGTLHVAHSFMGMFSVAEDIAGDEFVTRLIDEREVEVLPRHDAQMVTNRAPLSSYVGKIRGTLSTESFRIERIESERAGGPVVVIPPEYSRKKEEARGYTADFVLIGGGVRWAETDSGSPVNFLLNSNNSPIAGGGTAEIARAMNAWSQSGAGIRLQVTGQTGSCGLTSDGVNTISFNDCLNELDPPSGCSGVLAQTRVWWTNETSVVNGRTFSRLIETDVVFNKGMECFLGNTANLAETACHELGHAIGLGHSADSAAIMWGLVRGNGRDATLGADDKEGVLAIYPSSSGGGGGGGGGSVSIATTGLPGGIVNRAYQHTLSATGGTPPYRWNLAGGPLPPGLSLSQAGVIDGTPSATGSFSIIVMVTDSLGGQNGTHQRQLSLVISSDNGTPSLPAITRVKVKKKKKLSVFGQNFTPDSIIWLNGVFLTPKEFSQEGATGKLFYKGPLSLRPSGLNTVFVRNTAGWSGAHIF
ncbi:MAG TPA: matrixin family metalloprotease [Blastocatellia bacterium]|nr:matrixin family metalloprotease [Blastocatellia bacterium]